MARQPVTLEQLRASRIDFPAVVIGELEINGYVIERVYEHGRQIGVRLLETNSPRSTRLTPPPPMAPSFATATDPAKRALRSALAPLLAGNIMAHVDSF